MDKYVVLFVLFAVSVLVMFPRGKGKMRDSALIHPASW